MSSQNYNEDFRVPFRDFILDDLEINSLIGNRFYGAQLATLDLTVNSFPIAVFYPESGKDFIVKKFNLVIRCYSENHFDEAYDIYRAISERLGGQNGPVVINKKIIVRPLTTPTETYEVEPRTYGVGSRFLIHWIS